MNRIKRILELSKNIYEQLDPEPSLPLEPKVSSSNEAKDNHSKMIEDNNDPVYMLPEKSPAILMGKLLPPDCCEKAENDSAVISEVLEKIINYVERKCPFNYHDIENSDFSDCDPDYVPTADNTESADEAQHVNNKPKLKRKMVAKNKVCKKRLRKENEWKDNKAKKELNLGNEHENRVGKVISCRIIKAPCKENCRNRCKEKILENKRQKIFENFWELGDHTRQWDFVSKCVHQVEKKQIINKTNSRRHFSREYSFSIDNKRIKICKTMFLNTLTISETWVTTALKKILEGGTLEKDMRGRHNVRPNKIAEDLKDSVRAHIKLFPLVPSHYVRKHSNKMYLEEGLNITKMYRMYKEHIGTNGAQFATVRQYREIFNSEFNIAFFKPKKDQCQLCTAYKDADNDVKLSMQEKYDQHLANKVAVRNLKDVDKELATNDKSLCVACFDLQKVLVTPQSEVSTFYYKSKIATYNFTVYDIGNNEGFCYVWYEEVAKRGPNEISSCLFDFLKTQKARGVKSVILYSDNCGGQNRNRFIFSMFAYASNILNMKITHRFLEKGHTQNEGDSMHAVIETAKKRQGAVYTPSQWITLIKMAKVTGKPYTVKEMSQADFFRFSNMVKNQNWKMDENRDQIKISKIRELTWLPEEPNTIQFKYEFAEPPRILSLKKIRRSQLQTCSIQLPQLYTSPLPIDSKKLQGLLELCKGDMPSIPRMYHNFFLSLKSKKRTLTKNGNNPNTGVSSSSDLENEDSE